MSFESGAHGFDGLGVDGADFGEAGEVVDEAAVDDGVGGGGSGAEAPEVFEVAGVGLGSGCGEGGGVRFVAGEAEDLMAGAEEVLNYGGTDEACGTGDEDAHWSSPLGWGLLEDAAGGGGAAK